MELNDVGAIGPEIATCVVSVLDSK